MREITTVYPIAGEILNLQLVPRAQMQVIKVTSDKISRTWGVRGHCGVLNIEH